MREETIKVIREVFDIPADEPIVYEDKDRDTTPWRRLWDKLLNNEVKNGK